MCEVLDILLVSRDAPLSPAIDLVSKKLRPDPPDPTQQFICVEKFACLPADCATDGGAELIRETRGCQANHACVIFSAWREVPNDCLRAHG